MRLVLEPRAHTPTWLNISLPVLALLATLVLCSGLILLAGAGVIQAYTALFKGAFGSKFNFVETLVKAAPLIFTGLAVAVAFLPPVWPDDTYPPPPWAPISTVGPHPAANPEGVWRKRYG